MSKFQRKGAKQLTNHIEEMEDQLSERKKKKTENKSFFSNVMPIFV